MNHPRPTQHPTRVRRAARPRRADRSGRFVASAIGAVPFLVFLALLFAVGAARAQETPGGMQAGGEVSINGGEAYAGNGCAKAGPVTAGECEEDGKDGGEDKGGGGGSGSSEGAGPSGSQYDEEGADDAASESSETTQPVTEMEGTMLTEGTTASLGEGTDLQPEPAAAPATRAGLCAADGPRGETTTTTVEEVVDGDTVETPEGTVRLIGVDTPETVDPDQPPEPGGQEASDFTTRALEGEEVELELGEETKDDHGRTLAYAWTADGAMFNETLLREGMGELLIIPPNDAYEECLAAAETAAQDEGLGIWGDEAERTLHEGTNGFGTGTMGTTVLAPPAPETTAPRSETSPEEGDGRPGILQTLFGGGEDDAPEPAGDATTFEATAMEATTFGPSASEAADSEPSATGGQYEEPERQQPEAQDPETQEEEIQDPEVQEPEKQDAEIQEEEIQEPETQQGRLPDPSPGADDLEVAAAPAPGAETPAAETPAAETPATVTPAPAAPIATLPETSGVSFARVSLLLSALLLGSGVLTWSVLKRQAVSPEGTADGGPADGGPADEPRG